MCNSFVKGAHFLKSSMVMILFFCGSGNMSRADIPPPLPLPVHARLPEFPLTKILSDEPLGDFQSITIPLKRAGRLFLIEAQVDGQIGNLVFDTGASGLVLNRTYFRKYVTAEKQAGGGITGGPDKMHRIKISRIDISGLYYKDLYADVTDLGHIENRRGVKILGLFGLNMITRFEVILTQIIMNYNSSGLIKTGSGSTKPNQVLLSTLHKA